MQSTRKIKDRLDLEYQAISLRAKKDIESTKQHELECIKKYYGADGSYHACSQLGFYHSTMAKLGLKSAYFVKEDCKQNNYKEFMSCIRNIK
jgi:hypothetical protein